MSLINTYIKIKNRISNGDYILIDYNLFFNKDNIGKYTRFVIDDTYEIEQFKKIFTQIRINDSRATIYVCAYGNELKDSHGEKFLYADSIWINGTLSEKLLNNEFKNNLLIEPSRLQLLDVIEEKNQSPILYFSIDGNVVDLSKSSNTKYLDDIITLYWD